MSLRDMKWWTFVRVDGEKSVREIDGKYNEIGSNKKLEQISSLT